MTNKIIAIDLDETLINNKISYYQNIKRDCYKIKRDARKCLYELYDNGFKFHLITGRYNNYDNLIQVQEIVEHIQNKLLIKFESITFTSGTPKGIYAKELKCIYIIDDNLQYLSDCKDNNVVPILLVKNDKKKSKDMISFKNWYEINEFLLK